MNIEELATEAGSEAWDIWRDDRGYLRISLDGVGLTEELEKFARLVAAAEREACAKLADSFAAFECAKAIRSRVLFEDVK